MSLKEKAMRMNSGNGIEFMDGRTKGEMSELLGKAVTISNYDFINGQDGDYVVFIVKENDTKFYFGGKVLTENLKEFDEEEKSEVIHNGLPALFEERKSSKTKRTYINVTFYPDENNDLPF